MINISAAVNPKRTFVSYLEVSGLLPLLHSVFPVEFLLPSAVVLLLVFELCLVLQPHEFGAQLLKHLQLPVLHVLCGLVLPDHHRMFHLLLGPLLVQLLR